MDTELVAISREIETIALEWEDVAHLFRVAARAPDPARVLPQTVDPVVVLAERERIAWTRLRDHLAV